MENKNAATKTNASRRAPIDIFGRAAICLAGIATACLWHASALAVNRHLIDQSLAEAWQHADQVRYDEPGTRQLSRMQRLFVRLLRGERGEHNNGDSDIERDVAKLGWTLRSQKLNGVTWTVLAETNERRSGRGMYAFADHGRHALQAPHVPNDGLTGEILVRMAEDGLPRALAWNTVPRSAADLAHRDRSTLLAFSHAFAAVHPSEKIMQLHGFDTERRRTQTAADSTAIISAAHSAPSPELIAAVNCLKRRLNPGVRLYGHDVSELGGTTNSIARALRQDDFQGFIHVELSLPLRETLRVNVGMRRVLFSCLGDDR